MTPPLPRRSLIAGLLALAAKPALGQAAPLASVSVDVSRLRAVGAGPAADLVQAAMTDELRRVFAGRIGGRGPRLVVRVTSLNITASTRGGSQRGSPSDYLDGEALVVGPGGQVLARYPQLVAYPANSSFTDPQGEFRRIESVARAYAQWLGRKAI